VTHPSSPNLKGIEGAGQGEAGQRLRGPGHGGAAELGKGGGTMDEGGGKEGGCLGC